MRPGSLFPKNRNGKSSYNVWKTLAVIALLLLLFAMRQCSQNDDVDTTSLVSAPVPTQGTFQCAVSSVTDGDTLRCQDGTRIRLHAISAKERNNTCSEGHPCPTASADESTRALSNIVSGKTLTCKNTGQSYNRVTAICWTPQGTEVNCRMVQTGKAALWERFNRQNPICAR